MTPPPPIEPPTGPTPAAETNPTLPSAASNLLSVSCPSTSPDPLQWMRWIPASLTVLLVAWVLLIGVRIILIPLLAAIALAYLLTPLVNRIERRGSSRITAVIGTFTVAVLVLTLLLLFVLPAVWRQLGVSYLQGRDLLTDPSRIEQTLDRIEAASPVLHQQLRSQIARLQDPMEQERLRNTVLAWTEQGLFRLVDFTASLLDLLLIPFFVFYLLVDGRVMRTHFDQLIPPRYRLTTGLLLHQINVVLSTYVRSQLLIALVMGVLYAAGFFLLQVPLALTLGLLTGLLNFVPYLGTLTGLGLSLTFLALDGAGLPQLLGLLLVFVLVQSIEGYYLTPKLLGSHLDLHPLLVLVGLMIGGNLFGLLGFILAIPLLATTLVLLRFLLTSYRQSSFYLRPPTSN
jgi:predicted PurR-regulated permease PerM